jgi:hypothetical protein
MRAIGTNTEERSTKDKNTEDRKGKQTTREINKYEK